MGNEMSTTEYEGPPELLEGRDIPSIAKYIKSDQCRNIFVMQGAGVSTSAGIPDFRSPGTGLYANLQRLNLPYPEAVFEINYFRENPVPFYTLAKELFPGHYRPTPTHSFVRVLHNRKLLRMCFTQNIDTLERLAGVPDHAIVEAHGSFADQHCIECGAQYEGAKLREEILNGEIAHCYECGGLVKPDIVFFGEALPPRFHKTIGLLRSADLLIVMGTSLTVHPFASLTQLVPESCPRVLINMDQAGDIGSRPDDVVLLGKTDDVVRELCKALGQDWVEELDAMWKETEKYKRPEKEEEERKEETGDVKREKEEPRKKEDELSEAKRLHDEVDKLTAEVEKALRIGKVPTDEDLDPEKAEEKAAGAEETAPPTESGTDKVPASEAARETVEEKGTEGDVKPPDDSKL